MIAYYRTSNPPSRGYGHGVSRERHADEANHGRDPAQHETEYPEEEHEDGELEAGAAGSAQLRLRLPTTPPHSTAMIPDLDMTVPFVEHRRITHTVWFALAVGDMFGTVGAILGLRSGVLTTALFSGLTFLFGAVTVVSHLLADALTPIGIEPFAPVRGDHYTFDLFRAASPVANYALLALGGVVVAGALVAGTALPV